MSESAFLFQHPDQIALNYTLPSSDNAYSITFSMLDSQTRYIVKYTVIHACAITVCLSFFVLLVLFIRKKTTPIFVLNQAILLAMILRSSLFITFMLSPLTTITTSFTGIITESSRSWYRVSVAANASMILLVLLIQSSFTYQIYIIFRSPEVRKLGVGMSALSLAFMMVTFGFYVNGAVASTRQYEHMFYSLEPYVMDSWVTGLPPILFLSSVIFMSLVLVMKLIAAVRTRRYLGLKQFLGYHVLLIMATQTLFVPMILTILAYAFSGYNDILIHVSTTITVILLPFTSIWAAIANNSRSLTSASSFLLYGACADLPSPGGGSDEETLSGNSYAFFPDKLLHSGSPISGTIPHLEKQLAKPMELDDSPIPDDILEILNGDDDSEGKFVSFESSKF